MKNCQTSDYIEQERRAYSLYVLTSRAIPHAADGLKAAARRVLWTARNGQKFKSATLAGATMPIHPHASPEGTINTLAAPYGNNIPLLNGDGAFGTLLSPTAYGASRYTSVKVSDFTKDVLFKDLDIIPLQQNYDGTLEEPIHFLPLVPIALLNPQEGIAVGFASNILPRSLENIINAQIAYLKGERIPNVIPHDTKLNQKGIFSSEGKFIFNGSYEQINKTTIRITKLPYGITHLAYINKLNKFEETGIIQQYIDHSSKKYDIIVKFKRGILEKIDVLTRLKLINTVSENFNVVSFDGKSIWSPSIEEFIGEFCEWRLQYYVDRYTNLHDKLEVDIQRYQDVLTAIRKNVGGLAKKIKSREELISKLTEFGIVHVDYIASFPVYRFTETERDKIARKVSEAIKLLGYYKNVLQSSDMRKNIFIDELTKIGEQYG